MTGFPFQQILTKPFHELATIIFESLWGDLIRVRNFQLAYLHSIDCIGGR